MVSCHYLATVPRAFRAVHHNVDFGVGSGSSDVSCHNLDVVHDAYRGRITCQETRHSASRSCVGTSQQELMTAQRGPGKMESIRTN